MFDFKLNQNRLAVITPKVARLRAKETASLLLDWKVVVAVHAVPS